MLVAKVRAYPRKELNFEVLQSRVGTGLTHKHKTRLLALQSSIRLGWKGTPGTNTLAYY
jgi:hypothetical protein